MTKLLTVESLTQTKVPSLAKSFSPIQCLVLGQSAFQIKTNVKRHDQNYMIMFIIQRSNILSFCRGGAVFYVNFNLIMKFNSENGNIWLFLNTTLLSLALKSKIPKIVDICFKKFVE